MPERLPTPTSPSHACGVGPSLSPLKGGEGKCGSRQAILLRARSDSIRSHRPFLVMAGLVPAIHVNQDVNQDVDQGVDQGVDPRDKPGDDE